MQLPTFFTRRTGVCLALLLAANTGWAQGYPERPIQMIVATPAGGGVDFAARFAARALSEALRQPVPVDNRPGANGIIASETVSKAKPDGYTLLMAMNSTHAINPAFHEKLPYDAARDFAPIIRVATSHLVLVVGPSLNVTTVKQLVDLGRSQPGSLNYAAAGQGNITHLAGELFNRKADLKMTSVPYKGSAAISIDLIEGRVSMYFSPIVAAMPLVRSGRLRALAVTGPSRSPALPDVPTFAEAGFADMNAESWFGLFAPAGTSPAVVNSLNEAVARALRRPETQTDFAAQGIEIIGDTPEQFKRTLASETAMWARFAKETGIKMTN